MERPKVEELRVKGKDRRLTWQEVDALCDYALELEVQNKAYDKANKDFQECLIEANKDREQLEKDRAELSKLLIEERLFVVQLGEKIRDRVYAILEEEKRETNTA